MTNMSYCRFSNTASDLRDCVDTLTDSPPTSSEEIAAAKRMLELCQDYINTFDADRLPSGECEDCGEAVYGGVEVCRPCKRERDAEATV